MKTIGEAGVLAESERYITFPSDFARENLFFMDQCGHYYMDRHYLISRSAPKEIRFLIMYMIKGSLSLVTSSGDYTVSENEVAIVDTRNYHIYAANCHSEMYWIGFDGWISDRMVTEICRYGNVFIPGTPSHTLDPLREILHAFHEQIPLDEEVISAYIHLILSDLLQCARMKSSKKDVMILKAAQYIQMHYSEQITLDQLADMACLNPSYFSTKFKKIMGMSPKEYILNTRMRAAKILLQDTNQTVQQVAANTGFQYDAYFSNYFRRKMGLTPGEWRKSKS